MTEYMRTTIEVFPVAATDQGVWLLSGSEPWVDDAGVASDSNPWWDFEALLRAHGIRPSPADLQAENLQVTAVLSHQTSNRWDRTGRVSGQVNTFMSVLPDDVLLPGSRPVSLQAVQLMGRPLTHASTDLPVVITGADVLLHGLRHLWHLVMFDATARADMPPKLARHLEVLRPALAGLYEQAHQRAA